MSYCRADNESDVYVIGSGDGKGNPLWECVGCPGSQNRYGVTFHTRQKMVEHLQEHVRLGHKVPDRAFERLAREIAAE